MKESKEKLYQIPDELYGAAQVLKSFEYVLDKIREAYPVSGAEEIKAIIYCNKIYIEAVESRISVQLDLMDEILTEI